MKRYEFDEVVDILESKLRSKGFIVDEIIRTYRTAALKLDYGASYSILITTYDFRENFDEFKYSYKYNVIIDYSVHDNSTRQWIKRPNALFYDNTKNDLNELYKKILQTKVNMKAGKYTRFTFDERFRYFKKMYFKKLEEKSVR